MKKLIILLVFLLSINLVQAAAITIDTGRYLIINNEKICLDNITQVIYSDMDKKTVFTLSTGETRSFPTTFDEYTQIQQLVFASSKQAYQVPYNGNMMYYNTNPYNKSYVNSYSIMTQYSNPISCQGHNQNHNYNSNPTHNNPTNQAPTVSVNYNVPMEAAGSYSSRGPSSGFEHSSERIMHTHY